MEAGEAEDRLRLHSLLDLRGHEVNEKHAYLFYLEEGLIVRMKKRKRLVR